MFKLKKKEKIKKKKMYYEIKKDKTTDLYILWRMTETKKGYGCKGIFQGTKQECEEKLKEIKGE